VVRVCGVPGDAGGAEDREGEAVRLLDLFCGAGGAAMGYHRAGFTEIVGVDIKPQPRYPFTFVLGDALEYVAAHGHEFDAIHASPPCQDHSVTRHTTVSHGTGWMLGETMKMLQTTWLGVGFCWVVENVPQASFRHSLVLCGTHFGLRARDDDGRMLHLQRHRWFASSPLILAPGICTCADHRGEIGGVYGAGTSDRAKTRHVRRGGYTPKTHVRRALMGIDWMTGNELSQAIPPAYTEFIGARLLETLVAQRATV
jgi:DNA (cytosine-5)-methyltransferase 1